MIKKTNMKHTTTVRISEETLQKIKSEGMTIGGALEQGVKAMSDRIILNEEIKHLKNNITKLQKRLSQAIKQK